MALILSDVDTYNKFSETLKMAQQSFDKKLWNGKYYNFDCSEKWGTTIMSDQLCGLWYLYCCGIKNEVISLLIIIYQKLISPDFFLPDL